jgi:hypothetical protein
MAMPWHVTQPIMGGQYLPETEGADDFLPSAHNLHYDVYASAHGRRLGDVDIPSNGHGPAPTAEPGAAYQTLRQERERMSNISSKDYPGELDSLQRLDDVQGNGIFDPEGTHGNIHPDTGIFADREGIPGYLAREKFYKPSEIIDVNTGKPVVFVPGGAVAVGPQTDSTLQLLNLYEPGLPSTGGRNVGYESTVEPYQGAYALGQDEEEAAPKENMLLWGILGGLAIGAVAGLLLSKKGRR